MKKGLGSSGNPFINKNTGKDEYSPSTAKKKGRKKPIDLYDTGDFQREIFIDVREKTFVIDSADEKSGKLIAQFGGEIFGLNSETKSEVKKDLQVELKQQIKKQMYELQSV